MHCSTDQQDRVWLKNSDDGAIYYCEIDSSNVRYKWQFISSREQYFIYLECLDG